MSNPLIKKTFIVIFPFIIYFIIYSLLNLIFVKNFELNYEITSLFLVWYLGYIVLIFDDNFKIKLKNLMGLFLYSLFVISWIILSLIMHQNPIYGFFGEFINYWLFLTIIMILAYFTVWKDKENENNILKFGLLFSIVYLFILMLFNLNNIYVFAIGGMLLILFLFLINSN